MYGLFQKNNSDFGSRDFLAYGCDNAFHRQKKSGKTIDIDVLCHSYCDFRSFLYFIYFLYNSLSG